MPMKYNFHHAALILTWKGHEDDMRIIRPGGCGIVSGQEKKRGPQALCKFVCERVTRLER